MSARAEDWLRRAGRAYDAATRARELAERTAISGRRIADGAGVLHERIRRGPTSQTGTIGPGRPPVVTGRDVFHGDEDKISAVTAMDQALTALRDQVRASATQAGAAKLLSSWWADELEPAIARWEAFKASQGEWIARFATDWSTYQAWYARILALRSEARIAGAPISGPPPRELPQTIFERGSSGTGTRVEALWTSGKVVLYTALGIAGIWGLYAVAKDAKKILQGEAPKEEKRD